MNTAGVDPCPNCGAPLIPGIKCPSCNYNPAATTCQRCGTRFEGDKCGICGWSDKAPLCRYCGADLTDDHIVLKTHEDSWVWKNCAYCGAPIEKYLWTGLGDIEPYNKPYESNYHGSFGGGGGSLISSMIGIILVIFLVGALVGPFANLTTGITINHTGFIPNSNITSTISSQGIQLAQIFPWLLVGFSFVVAIVIFKKIGEVL